MCIYIYIYIYIRLTLTSRCLLRAEGSQRSGLVFPHCEHLKWLTTVLFALRSSMFVGLAQSGSYFQGANPPKCRKLPRKFDPKDLSIQRC